MKRPSTEDEGEPVNGAHDNTLHAALRIPYLDERERYYFRDRDEYIIKLVSMLGGVRLPDVWRIIHLTQPTSGASSNDFEHLGYCKSNRATATMSRVRVRSRYS